VYSGMTIPGDMQNSDLRSFLPYAVLFTILVSYLYGCLVHLDGHRKSLHCGLVQLGGGGGGIYCMEKYEK
jgi:hypothetical protein